MDIRKGDLAIWQEKDGSHRLGLVTSASRDGKRATSLAHGHGRIIRWREGWQHGPTLKAAIPTRDINVQALLSWLESQDMRRWTEEDCRLAVRRFLRGVG